MFYPLFHNYSLIYVLEILRQNEIPLDNCHILIYPTKMLRFQQLEESTQIICYFKKKYLNTKNYYFTFQINFCMNKINLIIIIGKYICTYTSGIIIHLPAIVDIGSTTSDGVFTGILMKYSFKS